MRMIRNLRIFFFFYVLNGILNAQDLPVADLNDYKNTNNYDINNNLVKLILDLENKYNKTTAVANGSNANTDSIQTTEKLNQNFITFNETPTQTETPKRQPASGGTGTQQPPKKSAKSTPNKTDDKSPKATAPNPTGNGIEITEEYNNGNITRRITKIGSSSASSNETVNEQAEKSEAEVQALPPVPARLSETSDTATEAEPSAWDNIKNLLGVTKTSTLTISTITTCSNNKKTTVRHQFGETNFNNCWLVLTQDYCENLYYYIKNPQSINNDVTKHYKGIFDSYSSEYNACTWHNNACIPKTYCSYYFTSSISSNYSPSNSETYIKHVSESSRILNKFSEEINKNTMLYAYIKKEIIKNDFGITNDEIFFPTKDTNQDIRVKIEKVTEQQLTINDIQKEINCKSQKFNTEQFYYYIVDIDDGTNSGANKFIYDHTFSGFIPVNLGYNIMSISTYYKNVDILEETIAETESYNQESIPSFMTKISKLEYSPYQVVIHAATSNPKLNDINTQEANSPNWPISEKQWLTAIANPKLTESFNNKIIKVLNQEDEDIKKIILLLEDSLAKVKNENKTINDLKKLALLYKDVDLLNTFKKTMYYTIFSNNNLKIPVNYKEAIKTYCSSELCGKTNLIPLETSGVLNYPFFAQKQIQTPNMTYNPVNTGGWIFKDEAEVYTAYKNTDTNAFKSAVDQLTIFKNVLTFYKVNLDEIREINLKIKENITPEKQKEAIAEASGDTVPDGGMLSPREQRKAARAERRDLRRKNRTFEWTKDDSLKAGLLAVTGGVKAAEVAFKYKMMKDELAWQKQQAAEEACSDFEELKDAVKWITADGVEETITPYQSCMRNMLGLAQGIIQSDHCLELKKANIYTTKAQLRACYLKQAVTQMKAPQNLQYTETAPLNYDKTEEKKAEEEAKKEEAKAGATDAGGAAGGGAGGGGMSPTINRQKIPSKNTYPYTGYSGSGGRGGYPYAGKYPNKASAATSAVYDTKVKNSLEARAAAQGGSAFYDQIQVQRRVIHNSPSLQLSKDAPYLNKKTVTRKRRS